MKILAIIPARGGSKGIPRKNLIPFLGKPLMQWSIEAALDSSFITDVVVSSDDDEILKAAIKHEGVVAIQRPKDLALDESRVEPVMIHALEELDTKEYDVLVLLQPTSPLRSAADIDAACEQFLASEATSLIGVCALNHHPYKTFKVTDQGYLQGIINNDFPFSPRQSLPKVFRANGAIYIVNTADFVRTGSLLTDKCTYFEMPNEKSVDIDTMDDIRNIEQKNK